LRINADALDYVMKGVLWVKCEDNKQRLVVFIFKLLNKPEKNHEIFVQDLNRLQKSGIFYGEPEVKSKTSERSLRLFFPI